MNIPGEVKIGGITYVVSLVDEVEEEREHDGRINYVRQTIKIKSGLAKDYTEQVFLHEVLHGVMDHCGIDLGDNNENITERLANTLYQVLKDNNIRF